MKPCETIPNPELTETPAVAWLSAILPIIRKGRRDTIKSRFVYPAVYPEHAHFP